jgi:hypothetical protein
MTKNKLEAVPFVNDIGQTIQPGDSVVMVFPQRKRVSKEGLYAGKLGAGVRISAKTKNLVLHTKGCNRLLTPTIRCELGCPEQPFYHYNSAGVVQTRKIQEWEDAHCHLIETWVTKFFWSSQKKIYKLK